MHDTECMEYKCCLCTHAQCIFTSKAYPLCMHLNASQCRPQTTDNNKEFALVTCEMCKMLICNQINLCLFLLRVNNRMETGAIECIHCSPCTPPFIAVNKHWQHNRLTDKPQVSASMLTATISNHTRFSRSSAAHFGCCKIPASKYALTECCKTTAHLLYQLLL